MTRGNKNDQIELKQVRSMTAGNKTGVIWPISVALMTA
jgi:hypothetical protein